jgi:hypothetical protein
VHRDACFVRCLTGRSDSERMCWACAVETTNSCNCSPKPNLLDHKDRRCKNGTCNGLKVSLRDSIVGLFPCISLCASTFSGRLLPSCSFLSSSLTPRLIMQCYTCNGGTRKAKPVLSRPLTAEQIKRGIQKMIGTDDARCLVLWQWVVVLRKCCCSALHGTYLHPNYHSGDSFSRPLLPALQPSLRCSRPRMVCSDSESRQTSPASTSKSRPTTPALPSKSQPTSAASLRPSKASTTASTMVDSDVDQVEIVSTDSPGEKTRATTV